MLVSLLVPLQFALTGFAGVAGQFVVFTKVVDKKTLNIILASVVSFFTTAIPLIFALLPDAAPPPDAAAAAGAGCALSAAQMDVVRAHTDAVRAQLQVLNASCAYNVSVGGAAI